MALASFWSSPAMALSRSETVPLSWVTEALRSVMEELSLETSVVAVERSLVSFVVTSFSWERSRTRAPFLPERLLLAVVAAWRLDSEIPRAARRRPLAPRARRPLRADLESEESFMG